MLKLKIVNITSYCFRLFKVHKKVFIANVVLAPFMTTDWIFKNDNTMELEKKLSIDDVETYGFGKVLKSLDENKIQYLKDSSFMIQQGVFKLDMDMEKNRKKLWR